MEVEIIKWGMIGISILIATAFIIDLANALYRRYVWRKFLRKDKKDL